MDRLKKIFDFHGGLRGKAHKIVEEAGETAVAIMDILHWDAVGDCNHEKEIVKKALVSEIADMFVVIEQIKLGANISGSEITMAMEEKISREVKRIDTGFYEKKMIALRYDVIGSSKSGIIAHPQEKIKEFAKGIKHSEPSMVADCWIFHVEELLVNELPSFIERLK